MIGQKSVKVLSENIRETTEAAVRVLLVEDDKALQQTLQRSLQRLGWHVSVCSDGAAALPQWQSDRPDVVLLDLNLPQLDGLDVLTQARAAGLLTPVIILTARGTIGDRVLGLNAGADDYLPKPFDLDELEARVRALHRRQKTGLNYLETDPDELLLGRLRIDKSRHGGAVFLDNEVLDLSPRELALLHALCQRPGHAVTKERLIERVFPHEPDMSDDAVEVVVYRLRKKLATSDVSIMTLRGLGYLIKTGP
jgi:two-component system response regulator TctD